MPIVPKYKERVSPRGLPANRFTASAGKAAFGGVSAGIFDRMAQHLKVLEDERDRQEVRRKRARAREAANQLSLQLTEVGSKYVATTGSDAISGHKAFQEEVDSLYNSGLKALQDDDEKQYFEEMAGSLKYGSLRQGVQHLVKNEKAFEDQSFASRIQVLTQTAIESPERAGELELEVDQTVREMNSGLPNDTISIEVLKNRSLFHKQIIEELSIEDPVKAYTYYKKIEKRLLPEIKDQYEVPLEAKARKANILQQVDSFVAQDLTLDEAYSKAELIKDPEEKQQMIGQIQHRYGIKAQLDNMKAVIARNELVGGLLTGEAGRTELLRAVEEGYIQYEDVPKILDRFEQVRAGVQLSLNYDKYEELFSKTNQEIAEVDLTDYLPYLPADKLAEAQSWQSKVLRNEGIETIPAGLAVKSGRVALQGNEAFESKITKGRPSSKVKKENRRKSQRRAHYLYALETMFRALPKNEQTQESAERLSRELLAPVQVAPGFRWPWQGPDEGPGFIYKFEAMEGPKNESVPDEVDLSDTYHEGGGSIAPPKIPARLKIYGEKNVRWDGYRFRVLVEDPAVPGGLVQKWFTEKGEPINERE